MKTGTAPSGSKLSNQSSTMRRQVAIGIVTGLGCFALGMTILYISARTSRTIEYWRTATWENSLAFIGTWVGACLSGITTIVYWSSNRHRERDRESRLISVFVGEIALMIYTAVYDPRYLLNISSCCFWGIALAHIFWFAEAATGLCQTHLEVLAGTKLCEPLLAADLEDEV
ncbi:hypothetical protein QBC46DRAFT_385405 [Diplogelasinospora grovesii]|uniref:Uncharacterized protein n=1 Tax=Diplogelasinospora grovesii TaxID=303347 RepID=A0AAN6N756_9PEZI|nr:hypothetical protein QBC46DRAFT_385405 [Diplogelasinospora grovesii]